MFTIEKPNKTARGNVGGIGIRTCTTPGNIFIHHRQPAALTPKMLSGRATIGTCVGSFLIILKNASRRCGAVRKKISQDRSLNQRLVWNGRRCWLRLRELRTHRRGDRRPTNDLNKTARHTGREGGNQHHVRSFRTPSRTRLSEKRSDASHAITRSLSGCGRRPADRRAPPWV